MDRYRIERVGREFIVVAGNVSLLKCETKRRAEATIRAALNLLDQPAEWQITIDKRETRVLRSS